VWTRKPFDKNRQRENAAPISTFGIRWNERQQPHQLFGGIGMCNFGGNGGFCGGNMCWIIILILLLCCCGSGSNGCECDSGCRC
jgi:hypothetical protein